MVVRRSDVDLEVEMNNKDQDITYVLAAIFNLGVAVVFGWYLYYLFSGAWTK